MGVGGEGQGGDDSAARDEGKKVICSHIHSSSPTMGDECLLLGQSPCVYVHKYVHRYMCVRPCLNYAVKMSIGG